MSKIVERLNAFLEYHSRLSGDEKGEAQVFCDRLFQAFGHAGYKEAGATLEERIKGGARVGMGYADLIWKPRLLLEMKKRGSHLGAHYKQAFDYWVNAVPDRPRYVMLCNFDEFWIYDFDRQLDEPVDQVLVADLPLRYTAFNFLFSEPRTPIFGNDREDVSRKAAEQVAELFKLLVSVRRGGSLPRDRAQRFILQLIVAMFAEDIDLLPAGTITAIARDCIERRGSSYDLFGGLFRQMNDPAPAPAGRYAGVPYFNGGLFAITEAVELNLLELEMISDPDVSGQDRGAASKNWSKVNPAIFGTLFQQSMSSKERHRHGRHFTSEADIQRIVGPTIIRPWQARIDGAVSASELLALRDELARFRVLDPSCGSGNFLYVAFREMARLELEILDRLPKEQRTLTDSASDPMLKVSPAQFFGLDNDPFAVELAKVTLMLAKKLAHDEAVRRIGEGDPDFAERAKASALAGDGSLPLDNLDTNIRVEDALFAAWPECDAIVGNPPYQSKNKLQKELGPAYLNKLRAAYPDIDGRADYCVYWFRIAHDHLKPGQRAGLVGTNTVRQNYSRIGGLDHIVGTGGEITEAVSSMAWPGDAAVHVSIVNWIKGEDGGAKRLYIQEGNDPAEGWRHIDLPHIPSSLSFTTDVTTAQSLASNAERGCYQGQTHGHKGFLWRANEARALIHKDPSLAAVLRAFLTADNLFGEFDGKPRRYVADFTGLDVLEAGEFKKPFEQIKRLVLPDREKAAAEEHDRNADLLAANPEAKGNQHHTNFLRQWWRMSYPREDMLRAIRDLPRYIVCGQVTKRPIFEFVSPEINPNAALIVFAYADDYSFGILQSSLHWQWFVNRCSTLTERFRYTSNTVWDSFPWPQNPEATDVRAVAEAADALRAKRHELCGRHHYSLRDLYRSLEQPGDHPLKPMIDALDGAVRKAYGMAEDEDVLTHLLGLNLRLAQLEGAGEPIVGPGLPSWIEDRDSYVTEDAVHP